MVAGDDFGASGLRKEGALVVVVGEGVGGAGGAVGVVENEFAAADYGFGVE